MLNMNKPTRIKRLLLYIAIVFVSYKPCGQAQNAPQDNPLLTTTVGPNAISESNGTNHSHQAFTSPGAAISESNGTNHSQQAFTPPGAAISESNGTNNSQQAFTSPGAAISESNGTNHSQQAFTPPDAENGIVVDNKSTDALVNISHNSHVNITMTPLLRNFTVKPLTTKIGDTSIRSSIKEITPADNASVAETTHAGNASVMETTQAGNASVTETTQTGNASVTETTQAGNASIMETTQAGNASLNETTQNGKAPMKETTQTNNASMRETTQTNNASMVVTTPSDNISTNASTSEPSQTYIISIKTLVTETKQTYGTTKKETAQTDDVHNGGTFVSSVTTSDPSSFQSHKLQAKQTTSTASRSKLQVSSTTSIPSLSTALQSGLIQNLLMRLGQLVPDMREAVMDRFNLTDEQLKKIFDYVQSIAKLTDSAPNSLQDLLTSLQKSGVFFDNIGTNQTRRNVVQYSLSWPKCQLDLVYLFNGLRTSQNWAVQMLDASGKPERGILQGNLKFMGNYLQCNAIHYRNTAAFASVDGKICRAVITPNFNLPGLEIAGLPKRTRIQWDFCLPKSCQGPDINKQLAQYNMSKTAHVYCTQELNISDDSGAVISLIVLGILGTFVVLGTLTDYMIRLNKKALRKSQNQQLPYLNGSIFLEKGSELNETTNSDNVESIPAKFTVDGCKDNKETTNYTNKSVGIVSKPMSAQKDIDGNKAGDPKSDSSPLPKWQRALLAFSIPRNTEKILGVKAAPGSIGCLHGIRVMSMGWVILGHITMFGFVLSYENPLYLYKLVHKVPFQMIINGTLSVDSFFLMSGLLTAYMFMKECGKKGCVTIKQGIMYYVHRYWRLTPSLMVWIMIVANLFKYIGEGRPAWGDYSRAQNCRDNWWINMLYINNVYRHDKPCVGVTWFLAHDMQFYIVAPLALIPWAYGKKILGFVMAAIFIGIHLTSVIWLEIEVNADMIRHRPDYSDKIYFKPYARVAPFAIGLMIGWILWKTKCQIYLNKYVVTFGWILSVDLILTLTLVTHDENKYDDPVSFATGWSHANRVAFETLKRPLWAAAISWVIVACANGYGGVINSILSWEGWLPLSRLTYSAFLVHLSIIMYEGITPESRFLFTITSLSYNFLATFVLAYAVGYILAVCVEAPMLALEKVVLS